MNSTAGKVQVSHPHVAGDVTDEGHAGPTSKPSHQVAARPARPWGVFGITVGVLAGLVVFLARPKPPEAAGPVTDSPRVDGRAVMLPQSYIDRLGIQTVVVREAPLTPIIKVVGTVAFNPEFVAAVGTRLRGLVRSVARFEGDRVKKGELLADIDSPELGSAQASVLMFRAQLKAAELNHARERELESRGLTTAREVEQSAATLEEYRAKLLAAEQQVSALGGAPVRDHQTGVIGVHQLRSPMAGTVVERHIAAGQSVEGHLTAFRVADLDHLWVELAVFERGLLSTRNGDKVELRPLSDPTASTIVGQVAYVGDQIDPTTRTAAVRVEVDNHERKLRPGQAVTAKIHSGLAAAGHVAQVPHAAVTYVDGKPTVFVRTDKNRFTATPVEVGDSDGEDRQIISGLSIGEDVVVAGVFQLKSELFR